MGLDELKLSETVEPLTEILGHRVAELAPWFKIDYLLSMCAKAQKGPRGQ